MKKVILITGVALEVLILVYIFTARSNVSGSGDVVHLQNQTVMNVDGQPRTYPAGTYKMTREGLVRLSWVDQYGLILVPIPLALMMLSLWGFKRVRHIGGTTLVLLLFGCASAMAQAPASSSTQTLKLFIKGSTAYANPAQVPVQTALLIVTPKWEGLEGASFDRTRLFVADLSVVLSDRTFDCTTAFSVRPPGSDSEFLIVAGRIEAFAQSQDWQTTSFGKAFADTTASSVRLALDKFSVDVQHLALKKKLFSKDNVQARDGQLVLERDEHGWTAALAIRADQVVAEGRIPLTLCPVVVRQTAVLKAKEEDRKKAPDAPLLGLGRVMDAAVKYKK